MSRIKAVFMILNIFFFWPNDFSITDCIKLPTFVHISCCDSLWSKSRSRGGANLPIMEKKLFWLTARNCDGHTAVRCRSSAIRQLSLTRRAMKVFAEAAVSNIYSANQTHSSHLRLFPLFIIFHEQGLKEQTPSSPPDTLFLSPLNVS